MAINWELGVAPDIIGNALANLEQGKTMRREESARNALGTLIQNPGDTAAFGTLAQDSPQIALQFRKMQVDQAGDQTKARQAQTEQMGRLLQAVKADPSKYSMARQSAISLGIPADRIPESYDPAWVDQQIFTLNAFEKDGGQALSNYGKIAIDRGLTPGTPEFSAFVTQAWQADQIKTIPYTAGGGVASYNPVGGQIGTVIQPNPGGYTPGAPVGNSPARKTVGGKTYEKRGDQWFEVGGPTPRASADFRP